MIKRKNGLEKKLEIYRVINKEKGYRNLYPFYLFQGNSSRMAFAFSNIDFSTSISVP